MDVAVLYRQSFLERSSQKWMLQRCGGSPETRGILCDAVPSGTVGRYRARGGVACASPYSLQIKYSGSPSYIYFGIYLLFVKSVPNTGIYLLFYKGFLIVLYLLFEILANYLHISIDI